jgi:hypothetical protein
MQQCLFSIAKRGQISLYVKEPDTKTISNINQTGVSL